MEVQNDNIFIQILTDDKTIIKRTIKEINIGEISDDDLDCIAQMISLSYKNASTSNTGVKCVTLGLELAYVDKYYRDIYYTYYSKQHYNYDRFCVRLSLFDGKISNLVNYLNSTDIKLIGFIVVRPIYAESIGHTIIDPKYLQDEPVKSVYCRTSEFKALIFGRSFVINAFPWRKQTEVQTCAEISLINIFEYYSNQYKDYPQILPSEIRDAEARDLHESAYPSRGINYQVYSKILCEKGFAARLYTSKAIENSVSTYSGENPAKTIKRLFHYYIESGIPVSASLIPRSGGGSGHSIICIGHSCENPDFDSVDRVVSYGTKLAIIDSADLFEVYMVADDNQIPYALRPFDTLTLHKDLSIQNLVVALYKNIGIDALQAQKLFYSVLFDDKLGILRWTDAKIIDECENENGRPEIVFRMFLASSATFLDKKTSIVRSDNHSKREYEDAIFYSKASMPKLVWVCQVYTCKSYGLRRAFAEIILDPTSNNHSQLLFRKIIALNYTNVFCYRHYNDINSILDEPSHEDGDGKDLDILRNGFEVINRNIDEAEQLYFNNFTGNLKIIGD
jgi:hypothetical protein